LQKIADFVKLPMISVCSKQSVIGILTELKRFNLRICKLPNGLFFPQPYLEPI
jgi:hypothetical protein